MWKIISGLFLGWSLGANDSANIFGTGVTTGTVKYRTAILLTAIFVLLGSILEGPKCMKTVGELSRLLPLEAFSCTLAAALTMGVLTYFAIPASSSQCIIGAVIGAGLFLGSADFSGLYKIISCWLFTPISGIMIGYGLHRVLGYFLNRTIASISYRNLFYSIGIITAGCYGAYSLGSNNVANVTGVYVGSGMLTAETASLIGGLSIAAGAVTYSKRVMMTVGKGIAPLDPFSALVTVLATAFTLHLFTQIQVPVSSSQAVVGAVVGVGLVGRLQTVSYKMLSRIAIGWLVTPIAAGFMAYGMLRWIIM
ncbi:anion permease [Thermodesulfobacteriota bacterium]